MAGPFPAVSGILLTAGLSISWFCLYLFSSAASGMLRPFSLDNVSTPCDSFSIPLSADVGEPDSEPSMVA